jgi:general secretion pathway protein I
LQLVCEENVYTTPNPYFRRVEVIVLDLQSTTDSQSTGRHIIKLAQVVPNDQ